MSSPNDILAEQFAPLVAIATNGADDGNLFIEKVLAEDVTISDGQVVPSYSISEGFGLDRVVNQFQVCAYSSIITPEQVRLAATELAAASPGNKTIALPPSGGGGLEFYSPTSPLGKFDLPTRIKLVQDIDAYIRGKDNRVQQVQVSLKGSMQNVIVVRADGYVVTDCRPMVALTIDVTMAASVRAVYSGRETYDNIFANWQNTADEALRKADVIMQAAPCPAGEMAVILGAGDSGVLWHEAVGHGVEADIVRSGSMFAGKIGERVAAEGVYLYDDGTVSTARGSLNTDDEGTPSQKTLLIEDGILVNYMKDRLHGRFYGGGSTGNSRRQSYRHRPIVRMTNTYMANGDSTTADIITDTKHGIYAVSYGGGQVNPMTGKFVFQVTEGYMVRNGQICEPVKGATLIGSSSDAIQYIDLIGNDFAWGPGGTCGKEGQGAPVTFGMPAIRLPKGITVGGTDTSGGQ